MARPRARRSQKNPSAKVSRKQKNPHDISFVGAHPLVRKYWDKRLTLKQNYERMGLLAALNGAAGGTEHEGELRAKETEDWEKAKEAVEWRRLDEEAPQKDDNDGEDEDEDFDVDVNGAVEIDTRVKRIGQKVGLKSKAVLEPKAPLKDAVVGAMEAEARDIIKLQRHASEQEGKVLGDLLRKHGRDYSAMSRDIKLNRYQLSAGQLRKRIERLINKT